MGQAVEKGLPAKGFGGKDSWKGNRQGSNVIQLRETCHSEAVTDVTAVGIRIQNVRENGLPRQSADWLAMTKPLTEWHWNPDGSLSNYPSLRILWAEGLFRQPGMRASAMQTPALYFERLA